MSDTKLLHQSFAGGEITQELHGRVDLGKFQTGLAFCRNFIILAHGPAQNRSGLEYSLEQRDSTRPGRLIPFSFSADQSMVLELTHFRMRFHTGGAPLLEAGKAISAVSIANPGVFTSNAHGYVNGRTIFLAALGGGPAVLNGDYYLTTNVTANTFRLTRLDGTAINTGAMTAYVAGGSAYAVYEIVTPYDAADLFTIHYTQDSDVITLTSLLYPAQELARLGATNWTITPVDFTPTTPIPGGFGVVATVAVATNLSPQTYCVTAVEADGVTESLASATVTVSNNLSLAGNYNTVSWAAVAGATRYNVFKQRGGTLGYIGQTANLSLIDDNILADTAKTPPEDLIDLNTAPGEYPQAVTYYEQRRWFGGTANNPQTAYATRNGTESNLTSSLPSRADDGLRFRIKAQQQNAIRHLLPLTDLLALTAGGEFRLFADGAPSITPDALSIKPQGFTGASNVQPALTSGSILYVQADGAHINELAYAGDVTSTYKSTDMSVMAPHLVDGYSIVDLAYNKSPFRCGWFVRNDGRLLGMTYLPEHQVFAWHQHDTNNGLFESVACVSENNESILYCLVKRVIGGRTVRNVERMRTRFYKNLPKADAFIVDSGVQYSGAPTKIIGHLWHLEGQTVSILADGAVQTQQVVAGGKITLAQNSSKVSVGLPIEADLETLPLAIMQAPASGQGTIKNVDKVYLRIYRTTGMQVGPSEDKLVAPAMRSNEAYGSSPRLRTQEISVPITPTWSTDGAVFIRQSDPVPTTILSMALGVTTGG